MKIIQVKNAQEGGKKAFEFLQTEMNTGISTVGLATGSTPEYLYQAMIQSEVDFSAIHAVNLDEYIGLSEDNPQSYHYFMNEHLFHKKTFNESFIPDGKAGDLAAECARYEEVLRVHPIDFQILGIGRNGHIGFNEPGTPFDAPTHVVELTASTIEANKRYFDDINEVPTQAVSMGIGSIVKGKKIVLMAFGKEKAEAIHGMIEGPITTSLPASILQNHPDVTVIIDEAAGEKLTK